MRRTLLACAVLCTLAGAANAQSSVITVFGVVDLNLRHQSNEGSAAKNVMGTDGLNSSRLGLRGIEDLGAGLKAGFWMEAPMTPNDGNGLGLTFKRRSTVSLIGEGWGELRLGRDYTPVFWTRAAYDPFGFNGVGLAGNVDPNVAQPAYVRSSNSVGYFLPGGRHGVYGQVMVAPSEGSPNTKYFGGRLGYAEGALDVSVAASRQDLNGGANRFSSWVAGGSFKLGFATLEGACNHDHNDTGAGATFKHWLLGTVLAFGQDELHASFNKMDAGHGNGARQLALGYVRHLSKRTALYGTASRLDNEGTFNRSVDWTYNVSPTPVSAGGSSRGIEMGIRHAF